MNTLASSLMCFLLKLLEQHGAPRRKPLSKRLPNPDANNTTGQVVRGGFRLFAVLVISGAIAGCASLPAVNPDRPVSHAIAASTATTLGRIAEVSKPAPELTGFRLMPLGTFSFDTRIELARRAERTLDVQYYHIQSDETGRYFVRALRDAAVRGVRVRLLMDDLYTTGQDDLLLGLMAHPNVELRLFNPFCCARDGEQPVRFAAALGDLSRVNHRMHNKLYIADGAMAVLGGRNIANEYFLRGLSENFVDMDVFTVGAILPDLANIFDTFWNHQVVYPAQALLKSGLSVEQLRQHFEIVTGPVATPPPSALPHNDALGYGPISEDLDQGRVGLIWGTAIALADHPSKALASGSGTDMMNGVTYNVWEKITGAQKDLVISSPYLIPGNTGMDMMRELTGRKVKIQVMTNSLAATDEPLVHIGYSRYRPEMIKLGVDVYELSSSRLSRNKRQSGLFGKSMARLHAKLVVIDQRLMFIGSMNLDPRSHCTNTEIGLIIDNPQLARELLRIIDIDKLQSAYRVRLAEPGSVLQWLAGEDEKEMALETEPDSTFGLRLRHLLLGPLVPEELL